MQGHPKLRKIEQVITWVTKESILEGGLIALNSELPCQYELKLGQAAKTHHCKNVPLNLRVFCGRVFAMVRFGNHPESKSFATVSSILARI